MVLFTGSQRPTKNQEDIMKAVEVLQAARTLLSDKDRWTTNALRAKRRVNGVQTECFCALGAVLKEGGGFVVEHSQDGGEYSALAYDKVAAKYFLFREPVDERLHTAAYAVTDMTSAATLLNEDSFSKLSLYISILSKELAAFGFQAKPTAIALRYLQAAAVQYGKKIGLGNNCHVVAINDRGTGDGVHKQVLAMFDMAIRNAKRRHLRGGRARVKKSAPVPYGYASSLATVVEAGVSL
jgi:hypothetical protein